MSNLTQKDTSETSRNFSFRHAGQLVRKLNISSGDIILLKKGTSFATTKAIDMIGKAIETAGRRNVLLLVVDDFDNDLRVMDAKKMREHGWIQLDAVTQFIRGLKKEE